MTSEQSTNLFAAKNKLPNYLLKIFFTIFSNIWIKFFFFLKVFFTSKYVARERSKIQLVYFNE